MTCPPKRPYKQTLLSEGRKAERHFAIPEHVVRNPDDPLPRAQCRILFSDIFFHLHNTNINSAVRTADRLCRQRPGNNIFLTEYARQLIGAEQYSKAFAILKKILCQNAEIIEALKLQGYLYMQGGQASEALDVYAKIVKISPADSFTQINLHALSSRVRPKKKIASGSLPRTTIATSIPPANIQASVQAVQSWMDLDFHVISVNTYEESQLLQPHLPEVEFYICEHTAREEFGKDYQYLDNILDSLFDRGSDLCGIVNADIVLRGGRENWGQVLACAKKRFVYGSRVNVNSLNATIGTIHEHGLDFFFFPREYLECVPRTDFVFGQPGWDIFFPAWADYIKFNTAFCYSPVALHVTHPLNWNRTAQSHFMLKALACFAPEFAMIVSSYPGYREYIKMLTSTLTRTLNRCAKGNSLPLFCTNENMGNFFAPVDPYYWAHATEETLVVF